MVSEIHPFLCTLVIKKFLKREHDKLFLWEFRSNEYSTITTDRNTLIKMDVQILHHLFRIRLVRHFQYRCSAEGTVVLAKYVLFKWLMISTLLVMWRYIIRRMYIFYNFNFYDILEYDEDANGSVGSWRFYLYISPINKFPLFEITDLIMSIWAFDIIDFQLQSFVRLKKLCILHFISGEDGDILPAAPPLEILDAVAGYEILSFDSGRFIKLLSPSYSKV